MKPAEFWDEDLTPYETNLWILESSKQGVIMAWNFAALNRAGKTNQFPKSPLKLIGEDKKLKRISDQESIANVKRFFEAQQKRKKK
jgi:hypothetical protein